MDGWKRAAVAEEQKVTIETPGGGWVGGAKDSCGRVRDSDKREDVSTVHQYPITLPLVLGGQKAEEKK